MAQGGKTQKRKVRALDRRKLSREDGALIDGSWSDQEIAAWEARLKANSPDVGYKRLNELEAAGCSRTYLVTALMGLEASQRWHPISKKAIGQARNAFIRALDALAVLADSELALFLHFYDAPDTDNLEHLSKHLQALEVTLESLLNEGASERRHLLQERIVVHIADYVNRKTPSGNLQRLGELIGAVLQKDLDKDSVFDFESRLKRARVRKIETQRALESKWAGWTATLRESHTKSSR